MFFELLNEPTQDVAVFGHKNNNFLLPQPDINHVRVLTEAVEERIGYLFFFKLVRETCHRSRTHRPGRFHKIKRLVFQVVWVDNPRAQLWICHRTHLQFHHACALERKAHVFLVFVEKGARTVEFECVETMESVAAPCCLCVADCVVAVRAE